MHLKVKKHQTRSLHLKTPDGFRIAAELNSPSNAVALLLWIHGYGSHRHRFDAFGSYLNHHNVLFASFDLRGHGDSSGLQGSIVSFNDYYQDVITVLAVLHNKYPKLPIWLGGHSMGGLIALRIIEEKLSPFPLQGGVVANGSLCIKQRVPFWKRKLALFCSKHHPDFALSSGIRDGYHLTDAKILEAFRHDKKMFKKARARWYTEFVKEQNEAIAKSSSMNLPILFIQSKQGKSDLRTCEDKLLVFTENANDLTQTIYYTNFYHEMFNEAGSEKIYKDVYHWIAKQIHQPKSIKDKNKSATKKKSKKKNQTSS